MTARRLSLIALAGVSAALAGCGHSAARHASALGPPPLATGAGILAETRACDEGANAFCALQLVVVDRDHRYKSSTDLLSGEHRRLHGLGWAGTYADTGDERAAESPGRKLRVTYATADGDLKGIDLGWIKRSPAIASALSRVLFDREPAISIMVEGGPS